MAGVGKLLKQAQKMQRSIESLQAQLAAKELEFSRGGGAVQVKINGAGQFLALKLDAEFLKEDAATVSSEILAAVQEAAVRRKNTTRRRWRRSPPRSRCRACSED